MAELRDRLAIALAGRYRIERELGRGGMGVVLLAHDLKHDRDVAIKVLQSADSHSVSGDRFLREIRIAAQLQHPNILSLIDSGTIDGQPYYVMPFVEGESLRDRISRESQLPIDDALQVAGEVADALHYAHEHGVIHRDIKPENILLAAGHAVVADFGVARALDPDTDARLTDTGTAIGTPAYMSPEQATGVGGFDHRTDIYSLGCVLYEMLTGTPPYTGANPMAVIARKAHEPVPSVRVVRDTVPPHVEQTLLKALAKVPADRFSSARQFASALSGDRSALGTASHRGWRSPRSRWMVVGAVGTVVVLTGIYILAAGAPWGNRPAAASAQFTQITSAPGVEWFPSLSPDGKWIVYSGQQSGNRDVYLQSVSGQAPINLTSDSPADDDQPAFSPDGEHVAFRSERDGGGIFIMARTGEGVRRVTNRGFRPTWSADGTELAFVTENVEMNPGNSNSQGQLWVARVAGGEPRRILTSDANQPAWSPHGQRIAFAHRLGGNVAAGNIWTVAANGGDPIPLTQDRARDWSPTWSRDGRYLYFSSNRSGSMNLWRVPVDEASGKARGPAEPVTTPATYLAHPTLSGDGSHVAYTSAQVSVNIQRIGFNPATLTTTGDPTFVTTGSRQWSSPDPSPDGQWVAFYTLTQPDGDVYMAHPDGSALRQVTADTAIDRLPRWSPDGKWLAFFSTRSGPLHIWKIRPDGSELQVVSAEPAAYVAWSPDSRQIATGVGSSGPVEAWRTGIISADLATPNRGEVAPAAPFGKFIVNAWSPDGDKLVGQINAVGAAGEGIAVYSRRTRTYAKVSDVGEWPVWLPDSRRILFVVGGNAFYVLDTQTKVARKIFSVQRDVLGPPRISRGGRFIYFSRRVTEADVWMLSLR